MILLGGPTATGKTAVAAELAAQLNGELISADSMQIYRGMDIGTAKERDEAIGVKQHLIDVVNPDEPFSVVDWNRRASAAIADIESRGKTAIIVGGTGLYLSSLMYPHGYGGEGFNYLALREKWLKFADEQGKEALWQQLNRLDPVAANAIHPNNVKRVVRALEVTEGTGKPFSAQADEKVLNPNALCFYLDCPRELTYRRIEARVDEMLERGLEEEVYALSRRYSFQLPSMQGIGYKEWQGYFAGEKERNAVREEIVLNTRHYAKRQLTWFRRYGADMPPIDRTQAVATIVKHYKNRA